ncbi:MAG: enolase C-terminal domain-like protein [Chloroflexota bacterium]|nr:enolase C-terminal domain-like protein [Chloroflexota bacterium]
MKITDIEIIVSKVKDLGDLDDSPAKDTATSTSPDIVLVIVHTEEGIDGYGFGWGTKGGLRTAHTIAEVFRPELINEDALAREYLWQKAHYTDRLGGNTAFTSYGPLDVALWDIAAKKAQMPLYKYLGYYRTNIPAYASSNFLDEPKEYVELAKQAAKDGYKAFKLHPPGIPELDIECCRAVREALPNMILMSDPVGGHYSHEEAIKVGRALEKLDFLWLEEPIYDHDIHGLNKICSTLDIPILSSEWNSDFFSKANYIKSGAADILRADVSWTGGITGALKTAHLAEAFGMNCEIHMTLLSLMDLANLHLALAIKNCSYLEIPYPSGSTFGIKNPVKIDSNGLVYPGNGIGLGVELDIESIESSKIISL